MSEQTDHQALARFLRVYAAPRLPDLAFVWHTPNESAGGGKAANGVPLDVLREAQMGAIPGVWDWLYIGLNKAPIGGAEMFMFNGVAIELKSAKAYQGRHNGLSTAQLVWRDFYHSRGWHTAVFCNWVEAAHLLIQWVGGNVEDFRF
jgi:hypothetical protein